ncbi:PREDICTED: uncharacterized protein LOC101310942 [Fragaria vesca subsp. vesca]
MERARDQHRQWRELMSPSERDAYLERRRAIARGKRPRVENEPSEPTEQNSDEINNEGTNSRIASITNEQQQDYARARLTHIRQLARSTASRASDADVRRYALYEESNNEGISSRNTSSSNNQQQVLSRVRLTHIRQLARSDRSHANDGVAPYSTRYELPNSTMNNHEENTNNVAMNNDDGHTNHTETMNINEDQCTASERGNGHQARHNNVHRGNIDLPLIESPPEMVRLFSDQTDEIKKFRQNIRAYNNVFAFTSMGVHLDERINVQGRAPYTFRAQGSIYHKIGGLVPTDGRRPRYLQAYIYDTEHELQNRLSESEVLERGIVEKIQQILNQHNPFVQTFQSLEQRQDLPNCRLIIREQPSDRRQYNLPTASQVAAVIVGGDDINLNGRDFIIQTISGRLQTVKDSVGYYDPMQYPLLLPYGTYGWDINSRGNNGKEMTCCDYYAYMLQMRQGQENPLHRGGRLLQQYVVDNYVKIESQKLRWFRNNQDKFRTDVRQGLEDSLHAAENNAEPNDKLNNPDEYDRIVRAEIPDQNEEPRLYDAVCTHMIHGPCGPLNPRQSCMKKGTCSKGYPKPFANFTVQGEDAYPMYRRRQNRLPISLRGRGNMTVDNRWVVPYNPWLLLRYNCHINVEVCGSIKSVKYLYKYIYKGPDRVSLELQSNPEFDEIRQFVNARWVCAPEALWKIFKFALNKVYPTVERLQIHLPNMQQVTFNVERTVEDILEDDRPKMSMLTEFFTLNQSDDDAKAYLYREIPEHYKWEKNKKEWVKRIRNWKVLGRIYSMSPSESEKFYLRVLLSHVRGPESFLDLLTVNGALQPTFKQAAENRGLLENDNSIRMCLAEASAIRMPLALRRLFVTILVYGVPAGVRALWDEFAHFMMEDYTSSNDVANRNRLLRDLNRILQQFGKNIRDYDLPQLTGELEDNIGMPRYIEDELFIDVPQEDIDAIDRLNNDQTVAFNTIMSAVNGKKSALFFVDGPGGTEKTYLYRALLANLRRMNHIVLATASSGIAANILPGGRTAHSRFKIPLKVLPSSMCSIGKQSSLAQLVRDSTAVI